MGTSFGTMPKRRRNISRTEAEHFLFLYNQLGTYEAVAKMTGRSSSSVSKWVKILQAESNASNQQTTVINYIVK